MNIEKVLIEKLIEKVENMTKIPTVHHTEKAYVQNEMFTTEQFKRIQKKHPEATAQAIRFNDEKAAFESSKLKVLPQDTFQSSKSGIKGKVKKVGEAIKGGFNTVVNAAKNHKVAAAAIGIATAAVAGFGIFKAAQHAKSNTVAAHQG